MSFNLGIGYLTTGIDGFVAKQKLSRAKPYIHLSSSQERLKSLIYSTSGAVPICKFYNLTALLLLTRSYILLS
jgi:hypothetical protein